MTSTLDRLVGSTLGLLEATEWDDVEEVGGKPLVEARREALEALDEISGPQAKPEALSDAAHTACQLVAEYFSENDNGCVRGIDYSVLKDGPCWNGYCGWIAEAGSLLHSRAKCAEFRSESIAEWYDVLEESAAALADHIRARGGEPDHVVLASVFDEIIGRHLER